MRVKSGQKLNQFTYPRDQIERIKSPGELCEFVSIYWNYEPTILSYMIGQILEIYDHHFATLLVWIFLDIQKGMKYRKKTLLDIYIGKKC